MIQLAVNAEVFVDHQYISLHTWNGVEDFNLDYNPVNAHLKTTHIQNVL